MTAHVHISGPAVGGPHRVWTTHPDETSHVEIPDSRGGFIEVHLWEEPPHAEPSPGPAQRTYEVTHVNLHAQTSTTTVRAARFNMLEDGTAFFYGPDTGRTQTVPCLAAFRYVQRIIDVTDEQDVPAEGDGATEPEPDIPCHSSVDLNPGDLGA